MRNKFVELKLTEDRLHWILIIPRAINNPIEDVLMRSSSSSIILAAAMSSEQNHFILVKY
jgi:hypothetical protein